VLILPRRSACCFSLSNLTAALDDGKGQDFTFEQVYRGIENGCCSTTLIELCRTLSTLASSGRNPSSATGSLRHFVRQQRASKAGSAGRRGLNSRASRYFWHSSSKRSSLKRGNYLLTVECKDRKTTGA
jgi:hypothetical protein